jgi:hypothetical protein
MGTVNKEIADKIAKRNGYYSDDPRVYWIIEYDNVFGGVSYGLEYSNDIGRYAESEFVLNPRIYWYATGYDSTKRRL